MPIVGCCSWYIWYVHCSASSDYDSSGLHTSDCTCRISVGKCPVYCVVGFLFWLGGQVYYCIWRLFLFRFFLSRLVTFLICGDEKVNVAHFSFFVVWGVEGEGGYFFSCVIWCFRLWIRAIGKWLFLAISRMVCHSCSRQFLCSGRLCILLMRNLEAANLWSCGWLDR